MTEERVHYKKLPGTRRGFFRGSSVWQGPDHLLLVRSWRFREEYKRYYMGDIQSIAVAASPRFHISTRSFVIGIFWTILFSISFTLPYGWPAWALSAIGLMLAGAWLVISARYSCVCRIYTAVSGDDLPSVYRTWTARKFMAQVHGLIAATQGEINGEWADAVDARRIGAPEETAGTQMPGAAGPQPGAENPAVSSEKRRLPLSEIFVFLLFVNALYDWMTRQSVATWSVAAGYGFFAVRLGLAIVLLFQHNRRRLRAGMQKLAIASILLSGGLWYANTFFERISAARTARTGIPFDLASQAGSIYRDFGIGSHLLCGIIGLVILMTQRERPTRGIIG